MRASKLVLLLIAVLVIAEARVPSTGASLSTTEVTLYAHSDPTATSVGGRVLTLSSKTASQSAQDMREGLSFTLVPSLSAPLRIVGSVSAYVWLRAQESARGTLLVTISEVTENASEVEIRSASVSVGLLSNPYQVIFGLGSIDHVFQPGSTLRFEAQFSPLAQVPVFLLWDSISTPTRLVLDVETVPRIVLAIADSNGKVSTVFPENKTGTVGLLVGVTVEDPFHGINVGTVQLSVTNASGFFLIRESSMNLTAQTETPFRLEYALPIRIPSGSFNITVAVVDAAGRTFLAREHVTVTSFHALTVILTDSQKRALSGLNVSILAGDQLIDEIAADRTGMVSMRVPSSRDLGPLALQVRKHTILIHQQQIEVLSDSTLKLELPLCDWAPLVRLQIAGLPVPGAKVDLYLNGTLAASSLTGSDGAARFTAVPLGTYEVAVASFLGSKRFSNVTHSSELDETILELPALSTGTILVVGAAAIAAILATFLVRRRRAGMRHPRDIAGVLGGDIPRPAVMMIVGPSGSGKSVLLLNILADSLRLGRHCVYISNMESPSKIRDQLTRIKVDVQTFERDRMLGFVDAYSGGLGTTSHEAHSVPSPTDLTTLGMQLTSCVEELGGEADVFFDSLTPIVTSGRVQQGLDFVRYYGARTSSYGGTFLLTATATAENDWLGRLEEFSDCVLQTERTIGAGKIRGRLLVKKLRGREHEHDWIGYRITKGRMEFVDLPN